MDTTNKPLSPAQAAHVAGVSRVTVNEWCRQGLLAFTWGRDHMGQLCRMVREQDLLALMNERKDNGGKLAPRSRRAA